MVEQNYSLDLIELAAQCLFVFVDPMALTISRPLIHRTVLLGHCDDSQPGQCDDRLSRDFQVLSSQPLDFFVCLSRALSVLDKRRP